MPMPLISTNDLVVAAGHPRYLTADVKNRAGQYIQEQIEGEHDSDGRHLARSNMLISESDTFTGNGTSKTITLSNTNLTPVFVSVCEIGETGNLATNGGFTSDTTGWTATAGTIASVAGGQSGNCCEVTQGTTNLVVNGGFESDLTGWVVNPGPGGSITGGVAGGQSGNCCESVNGSAAGNQIYQVMSMIESAEYTISFYLKSASPNDFSSIFNGIFANHSPAATWGQFTRTATIGIYKYIGFYDGQGSLTRYIDTVVCNQVAYLSQSITTVPGRRYTASVFVKSGSSGNEPYILKLGTQTVTGTSSGTWTESFNVDYTATGTSTDLIIYKGSNTAGTMLFDTVTVIENLSEQCFAVSGQGVWLGRATTTAVSNISAITKGSFAVTSSTAINHTGIVNYYTVLGYDTASTFTRDAGGTDPEWVEDGEQGVGGAVGTEPANRVETHIETQYLVAHADAGTHTTNPYATTAKIEKNTVTATGSSQAVTLESITTVAYLEIWKGSSKVCFASADMTAGDAKKEGTAAFQTGIIDSLDTGGFHFTGTASATYYFIAFGV